MGTTDWLYSDYLAASSAVVESPNPQRHNQVLLDSVELVE